MTDIVLTEITIKERIQKALNGMILRWLLTLFCIALTAYALFQANSNGISPKFISEPEIKVLFLSLHAVSMLEFANICTFIFRRYQSACRLPLEKPYAGKLITLKALAITFLPVNIILWLYVQVEVIECYGLTLKLSFN